MKRMVRVLSVVMCLLFFFSPVAEAVTFTSSGGSAAPVKKTGNGAAPPGSGRKIGTVAKLDLPKSKKTRLADSIELVRLTGIQASLALRNLEELDTREATGEEMKARLNHAIEACDALEKAGKRLEDSVRIVRVALRGETGPESFSAALDELFEVFPFLVEVLAASPAIAFDTPMDEMEYQMQEVGKQLNKEFGAVMDGFSRAAQTVQNTASSIGRGLKNAVGWVADKVAAGHHKIGSVIGQKNWATAMAGTKFVTAVTLAGVGLVVVISAPAVSAAGAVTAVAVYTAANVGACVSFASDMSQIHGGRGVGDVETATTRINQATSLIGVVSGDPKEITLAVLGATGDEIANTTGGRTLSPEELAGYLNAPDRQAFLDSLNARRDYQSPADTGSEGRQRGQRRGMQLSVEENAVRGEPEEGLSPFSSFPPEGNGVLPVSV
ncbi:hypothetical protein [Aminivibrio sp.]|uniref:hypothetical protein n=1 Tax=Aminivibrio sp. TaxID=1872489 RepID=UPI003D96E02C